jgi:DNA repair exonuclease SbcCD ATPase subunit
MDTLSKQKTGNYDDKLSIGNVRDVEFQNELIRDYLKRQYFADADTIDKIQQINRELNTRLVDEEAIPNIQWIPKTFEFSNMFSYGPNNLIRFDNAKGMVGVFAPNASGKSSLFDAISFCIFDKTSRTYLAKNILNNRKTEFDCKLNFQIDGVDYFIERKAKIINKGKNIKVDVDFWKVEDGLVTSLNGEQRRETNSIIQQYMGSYEDFVLTTLSLQGNNALFIDKSQTERKEILAQFMGVDVFDKLYTIASDENRDNASLIRKFKQDDFTQRLADIETNLISKNKEYSLIEAELNEATGSVDNHNQKLISLNEKIVPLKSDTYSLDELENKKSTLGNNLTDLLEQQTKTKSDIVVLETERDRLLGVLGGFDEADIESGIGRLKSQREQLRTLTNEIEKIDIKLESLYDKKEHLDSHKYNEECNVCMENSATILQSKKEVVESIKEFEERQKQYGETKIELESSISSLLNYETSWKSLSDTKSDETKVERELSTLINKLSTIETQEVKLENEVKEVTQTIADYLENEKQIQKNKEIRNEIQLVRTDLASSKTLVEQKNKLLLNLNGDVSSLTNQKETIEERIKEVEDLEEQFGLYEYYLNALSKDGISYELISKALPMIEGEVNNILGQIVEFGVQLDMDGKNINANIVYDDQKWSLEMCSGMEKFISGLAIRIALINVCNLPRPNFLVVDEGFGTLDNENLTSLYMLFAYLKTQFDFVMIISHIDSMRDVVDTLMEIKKVNGFSNVKF